jgi:hypothetical protein
MPNGSGGLPRGGGIPLALAIEGFSRPVTNLSFGRRTLDDMTFGIWKF